MPLKAGEFSFHHGLCPHRSGPNRADHRRIGLAFNYIPAYVKPTGSFAMSMMLVRGEDDMARLAVSFNDMAESLHRQITQLEEFGNLQRRFTSDVSHELRTPLTTVRMAADLIHDHAFCGQTHDRGSGPHSELYCGAGIFNGHPEKWAQLAWTLFRIALWTAVAGGLHLRRWYWAL